jgi:glutamine amidotransferase
VKRVAVVDYGSGNLHSVENALARLGYAALTTGDPAALAGADAYILPGVGAFGLAIDNLRSRGLDRVLGEQVLDRRKPFLGICLGMQLLAQDSTEGGRHEGLGWIEDGHVVRLEDSPELKVPHVGWNEMALTRPDPLFSNLQDATCYFDHSYHLTCGDAWVAARVAYGGNLVAAIQRDHIFAVQFHPEKSQVAGLRLLRNFLTFVEGQR